MPRVVITIVILGINLLTLINLIIDSFHEQWISIETCVAIVDLKDEPVINGEIKSFDWLKSCGLCSDWRYMKSLFGFSVIVTKCFN